MSVEQSERSQHRDQSKRVLWHKLYNWANDFPVSSKEHQFYSVQIFHIKQPGTRFQILELCFPSQWYQQNNKSATERMTQSIPNNQSIYIHKEWATRQEISRWSTDSSLQQHTQQRFAKVRPRSIRLSKVRIWPWAIVHIKNATFLGTFTFQMPFHGKVERVTFWILW